MNFKKSLGFDFIGWGLKECVGPPPNDQIDKKKWNDTSYEKYPRNNENLVIDDHLTHIPEDPNDGILVKVKCPASCSGEFTILQC